MLKEREQIENMLNYIEQTSNFPSVICLNHGPLCNIAPCLNVVKYDVICRVNVPF